MNTNESKDTASRRILIVDDDPGQRRLLDLFLKGNGFETQTAESGPEALDALRAGSFGMMISDVRMPGMSGLETLRKARTITAKLPVLLVTAYADIREAVDAMRDGALNYLSKPIDLDELLKTVRSVLRIPATVSPQQQSRVEPPAGMIAESPLMQSLLRDLQMVAPSECRVLVTGESGVGKEVIADVIHQWSPRANGPLVKVNCAAIPETLLESELFGHEKGSFTGAIAQRVGRFEEAKGGSIFLDEIGEMAPELQAKLLRVIQDGRFRRIGSSTDLHTDARIIAATNRDLVDHIKVGKFREDLYFRLNVVELTIPPLRERLEDIIPLAQAFIARYGKGRVRLSPAVIESLQRYTWPGNVRELANSMERAALLSRGDVILPDQLPARIRGAVATGALGAAAEFAKLDEIERDAILRALRKHNYNRTETAKALDISRRALTYKLQAYRTQGFEIDPVDAPVEESD
jgi:DNA-binding NtrC family response regulator